MEKPGITIKKKLLLALGACVGMAAVLCFRVGYIQIAEGERLQSLAYEQQTRDRLITPKRGDILDRNGVGLGVTKSVTAVSVIHAQIEDEAKAAAFLSEKLEMDYDKVLEMVSRKVALQRIKTKVDKEVAAEIIAAGISGIVVDEDVKRVYPYSTLASHVLGFVGKDNQGIIGLESKYDEYLKGEMGKILTETDARGIEVGDAEERVEPVPGGDLVTSIDVVIQQYAEQIISNAVTAKNAKSGLAIVMNPQNGEILAMAMYPDFDLNEPFKINNSQLAAVWDTLSAEDQNTLLNKMWRNTAINDTYEPGSTFKIVTTAAGLQEGVVTLNDTFFCSGFHTVADRMIKCWRYPRSHGSETFLQGVQNSCNPVFMIVAERLGAERYHDYLLKFGFDKKTGIDLPGEAVGIMYAADKIGPVELATMAFGQSISITPMQLMCAASAAVNGGHLITPHFGLKVQDDDGNIIKEFVYDKGEQVISEETSETMKYILENVVSGGTGNKTYIPGYRIGGKTATSEKLPRKNNKYIASFLAFAPAEDPQVMAMVLIDEPVGVYYGGTVAGPVMKEIMGNILPYLGIEPVYTAEEEKLDTVKKITVPDFAGMTLAEARSAAAKNDLSADIKGGGETVVSQFPWAGAAVAVDSKVILYTEEQ